MILLLVFGSGIWFTLHQGSYLPSAPDANLSLPPVTGSPSFSSLLLTEFQHPISLLLAQIVVIVLAARIFSFIFKRIGQPAVIGEIIAGILLGPSFLGQILPSAREVLFPATSLGFLMVFSQLGLIFFMFIIGMEVDIDVVKKSGDSALFISHTSIIFPFFCGVTLAYFIFADFAPPGVSFLSFALFTGIAVSITAFPVLARIIQEKGLSKTDIGNVALTCAAVDDLSAWCILAVVVAAVKSQDYTSALFTMGGTGVFILSMMLFVRPIFNRISRIYISGEILGKGILALVLLLLLLSSFFTEIIGIHALFGAFLAGVIMPTSSKFRSIMTEKLETISEIVLLPLFFALTGLRTELFLINDASQWVVCGAVLMVAVIGKFGGSAIAARMTGLNWRSSAILGALMNTRGLVELIVLNIGYELGVISRPLFSMLVLMAITTTMMTGPLLALFRSDRRIIGKKKSQKKGRDFRLLLAFGPPDAGISLLRLAEGIVDRKKMIPSITALHLTPASEFIHREESRYLSTSFKPILDRAKKYGIELDRMYSLSTDIAEDIVSWSRETKASCVLMGTAKTLFGDNILAGKVGEVIRKAPCSVAVFQDRTEGRLDRILAIYDSEADEGLLYFAARFAAISSRSVTLVVRKGDKSFEPWRRFFSRNLFKKRRLAYVESPNPESEIHSGQYDLVILGHDFWNRKGMETLQDSHSSLLILHNRRRS